MREPTKEDVDKALAIEARVRELWPVGARVSRTIVPNLGGASKFGTIVGYAVGGDAIDGVASHCCPIVHWDGNKQPSSLGYYKHVKITMVDSPEQSA